MLLELVSACPTVSNRIRKILLLTKQKPTHTQRRDFRMFRFSKEPITKKKMTYRIVAYIQIEC